MAVAIRAMVSCHRLTIYTRHLPTHPPRINNQTVLLTLLILIIIIIIILITEVIVTAARRPFLLLLHHRPHHRPHYQIISINNKRTFCRLTITAASIIIIIKVTHNSHRFYIIIRIIRWRWRPRLPFSNRYCRRRQLEAIQRLVQSTK